jgi:uncharacterized protein
MAYVKDQETLKSKSEKLDLILMELESFAVAFSGGVDSSFLLYRAHLIGNIKTTAVTIRTTYIPAAEIEEAAEFTAEFGINHKIIDFQFPEKIRHNPIERCYFCKKSIFTAIHEFAEQNGFRYVVDGTNADDKTLYRPGLKALSELGIRNPLLESGLTKNDIRKLSRKLGLSFWDKPAKACLLTRIPYDTKITDKALRMIEDAERVLTDLGFQGARVRIHNDLARIEALPGQMDKMVKHHVRELIISNLKKIGFKFISLDLEGYRSGSYDPVIKKV